MTAAEAARDAVRTRPFLYDALRAGVLNYAAAAEYLDLDADDETVATALRRYRRELDAGPDAGAAEARVTMESGFAPVDDATGDAFLRVSGVGFAAGGGDLTAVIARGGVDARGLERALGRLRTGGVDVVAAAFADGTLAVVVGRRAGAATLRAVEGALTDGRSSR